MELMEGGSLRPLVGDLSLPKVARVLEDLLAAVAHAGRAGIVHRDLKPENALITKDGRVKVADFGIAKAAESGQQGLTSEGMTVGTPEYMSPEQAMAKDIGPQSDLYSIGCMTYEMLTGRLPFREASQVALLMRHVNDPVPDVREVDPLIPETAALWVARATAKDPDDRFEDASAAWEAFEEAVLEFVGPFWRRDATLEPASEIDLDEIPPQGPTPLRPASRGRRTGAAAVAGATGFQTYHAPAALHEQLASEGIDVAPALATPPPAATAAAPRRVTPAPSQTAPAPIARAVKPVTAAPQPRAVPAAQPARGKGMPTGPIAAGAALAAIVAFVVGLSGGGGSPIARVDGDGFVLKAPPGWKAAEPAALGTLGAKAIALAPAGAPAGAGIAAGRATAAQAAALTRGAGEPSRVKLGAGDAARYTAGGGATLYVLPTDGGALVVACGTAPAAQDACAQVAGSVELTRGEAQPPGPTDAGARAVGGALNRLRAAIRNPTEDLRGAGSRSGQALAATDLARAYREAAGQLRTAPVGALAISARDELAAALRDVASAWASYARAVPSADVGGARSAVRRARSRVTSARAALAAAGYPQRGG
jgi:hypothetical protein